MSSISLGEKSAGARAPRHSPLKHAEKKTVTSSASKSYCPPGDFHLPTLLSSCQAALLVPTVQKRHRQTGEGPEEGCEDDQSTREPAWWGKTERVGSFLPGEETAQETFTEYSRTKRAATRKTESLFWQGATGRKQWGNRYKLQKERFHDVRIF